MWEPEWLSFAYFKASQLQNIFYHPEIQIITNSDSDKNLVDKLFDKQCQTIQNWNIQEMEKLCQTFSN